MAVMDVKNFIDVPLPAVAGRYASGNATATPDGVAGYTATGMA
jgi:hypothetical protein